MTLLAVMRHAKSDWGDADLADFDRPLNDRGRKAAKRVGRDLKLRRFKFDQVIASPALRVRQTLAGFAEGFGEELDVRWEPDLYGAGVEDLMRLVRAIPAIVHAPLLVGHNPGLQQLVLGLTSDGDSELRRRAAEKFPTAAVALIALPAVRWDEAAPGSGRLSELILPRELD